MRLPVWTFFRRSYKFQSFYAFARFRKDNLPQTSTFDSLFLSFRDKKVIHTVVPVVVIPWELLYSKVKRGTVKWVMFRTSNREGDEAYKESLFWNNILPKYDWRHRRTFVRRDWPQKARDWNCETRTPETHYSCDSFIMEYLLLLSSRRVGRKQHFAKQGTSRHSCEYIGEYIFDLHTFCD